MKIWLCFIVLIICDFSGASESLWVQKYGIDRDYNSPFSYSNIAKKDYRGVTIRVICFEGLIGNAARLHGRSFEELTGAKVEIVGVPFVELYTELRRGIQLGKYDVGFHLRNWLIDIVDYVEPVPDYLLASAEYQDIASPYDRLGIWEGKVMEVTVDGDRHYLQYRADLLEDPKFQTEFQEKFGRPLTVPATWKELNEVASFFHGRVINGKKIYGMAEATDPKGYLYTTFFKRAASYAKHPNIEGGYYFDVDTMEPQIDNPGFVEALKDMTESSKYYPPGWESFSVPKVMELFANGHIVFTDFWDDSFILAMEKDSPVRNKVKASMSPGSKKVWDRKNQRWQEFDFANKVPYLVEGWSSVVSRKSKNKRAAFDFLGFMSNKSNHRMDILVGERGVNLFRKTDIDSDYFVKKNGWDEEVSSTLIDSFDELTKSQNRAVYLQINGANEYTRSIATSVYRALKGRISAEQALSITAATWSELNLNFGIDEQRKAYKNTVLVEDH